MSDSVSDEGADRISSELGDAIRAAVMNAIEDGMTIGHTRAQAAKAVSDFLVKDACGLSAQLHGLTVGRGHVIGDETVGRIVEEGRSRN